jgi:hypothetical protein
MKMAVFWVVVPCSLAEVSRRFRGTCCLHHQGDRGAAARGLLITLMMEAASISETSANFYETTWLNNPEDRHVLTFFVNEIVICYYCSQINNYNYDISMSFVYQYL